MTKIYYFTTSVCLVYKIKPKIAFGTSLFFRTCKIQLYIFRENGPLVLLADKICLKILVQCASLWWCHLHYQSIISMHVYRKPIKDVIVKACLMDLFAFLLILSFCQHVPLRECGIFI